MPTNAVSPEFSQGYQSYQDDPTRTCPYQFASQERGDWIRGWSAAQDEALDQEAYMLGLVED